MSRITRYYRAHYFAIARRPKHARAGPRLARQNLPVSPYHRHGRGRRQMTGDATLRRGFGADLLYLVMAGLPYLRDAKLLQILALLIVDWRMAYKPLLRLYYMIFHRYLA